MTTTTTSDAIVVRGPRTTLGGSLAVAVVSLAGCGAPVLQAPLGPDGAGTSEPAGEHRSDPRLDHGYSILFDLLADEAKVEEILVIKSPRPAIADLLRHISKEATVDRAALERHLDADPPISIGATGLPIIETDARHRIENAETPALLFAGGRTFETRMLLTQQKAAQYASALAESLGTADPNSERSAILKTMAHHWHELETEIRGFLTVVEPRTESETRRDPTTTTAIDPE